MGTLSRALVLLCLATFVHAQDVPDEIYGTFGGGIHLFTPAEVVAAGGGSSSDIPAPPTSGIFLLGDDDGAVAWVPIADAVGSGLPARAGKAGEYLRVKTDETGFEWAAVSSGGGGNVPTPGGSGQFVLQANNGTVSWHTFSNVAGKRSTASGTPGTTAIVARADHSHPHELPNIGSTNASKYLQANTAGTGTQWTSGVSPFPVPTLQQLSSQSPLGASALTAYGSILDDGEVAQPLTYVWQKYLRYAVNHRCNTQRSTRLVISGGDINQTNDGRVFNCLTVTANDVNDRRFLMPGDTPSQSWEWGTLNDAQNQMFGGEGSDNQIAVYSSGALDARRIKFQDASVVTLRGLPARTGKKGNLLTVTADESGVEWSAPSAAGGLPGTSVAGQVLTAADTAGTGQWTNPSTVVTGGLPSRSATENGVLRAVGNTNIIWDATSDVVLHGLPARSGNAGKVLTVNKAADGIEWTTPSGGGGGGGGATTCGWNEVAGGMASGAFNGTLFDTTYTITDTNEKAAIDAIADGDFMALTDAYDVAYQPVMLGITSRSESGTSDFQGSMQGSGIHLWGQQWGSYLAPPMVDVHWSKFSGVYKIRIRIRFEVAWNTDDDLPQTFTLRKYSCSGGGGGGGVTPAQLQTVYSQAVQASVTSRKAFKHGGLSQSPAGWRNAGVARVMPYNLNQLGHTAPVFVEVLHGQNVEHLYTTRDALLAKSAATEGQVPVGGNSLAFGNGWHAGHTSEGYLWIASPVTFPSQTIVVSTNVPIHAQFGDYANTQANLRAGVWNKATGTGMMSTTDANLLRQWLFSGLLNRVRIHASHSGSGTGDSAREHVSGCEAAIGLASQRTRGTDYVLSCAAVVTNVATWNATLRLGKDNRVVSSESAFVQLMLHNYNAQGDASVAFSFEGWGD